MPQGIAQWEIPVEERNGMETNMNPSKQNSQFVTGSDIPVKEVYTAEDVAELSMERDLGLPGSAPYTRGIYPNMYRGKLWTIRQFSGFGVPEETNQRFRQEYELGQTGLSIAFDAVTENGFDADDRRAALTDVGVGGVPVSSLRDMEALFEGIPLDKLSTAVVAMPITACPLTAMYFAVAEKKGVPLSLVDGTTQNDLLLTTICYNTVGNIPPRHLIRLCVDLVEWCAQNTPRWHPVSFASYNYRENGITAYEELGLLLANAIGYTEEELRRHRLKPDEFLPVYSVHLAAHSDFLEEIAKFRAARRMWHKLMTERYRAKDPHSAMLRLHVQTSGSTLVYQQPLNNVIRVAYEVLAAVLGGAQSLHATSYDEPLCLPTEQGVLLSIRTQQIAQYETRVANVADPLGGSYYLEWLTSELEKKAWDYLQRVEEKGGIVAVLESGWLHREWRRAMAECEARINKGETKVVGTNCFEMEEDPYQVPVFRPNPEAGRIQKAKLERLRLERDNEKVAAALKELREVTVKGENVMQATMEAVKAYATLGEICDLWREIYSVWRLPIGL